MLKCRRKNPYLSLSILILIYATKSTLYRKYLFVSNMHQNCLFIAVTIDHEKIASYHSLTHSLLRVPQHLRFKSGVTNRNEKD